MGVRWRGCGVEGGVRRKEGRRLEGERNWKGRSLSPSPFATVTVGSPLPPLHAEEEQRMGKRKICALSAPSAWPYETAGVNTAGSTSTESWRWKHEGGENTRDAGTMFCFQQQSYCLCRTGIRIGTKWQSTQAATISRQRRRASLLAYCL